MVYYTEGKEFTMVRGGPTSIARDRVTKGELTIINVALELQINRQTEERLYIL